MDPFIISNPYGKFYKFLFCAWLNDSTYQDAMEYVNRWALEHGWTIRREKTRNIHDDGKFEIMAWLK